MVVGLERRAIVRKSWAGGLGATRVGYADTGGVCEVIVLAMSVSGFE